MKVAFLSYEQVLRIHCSMIDAYGGIDGLRDEGLLRSAVAMPQASFRGEHLHSDIFEMAAAYLFHIVQNHAFLDGNKRAGAASAIVFLAMNGIQVKADEDGLVEITMQTATGKADKKQIAEFFQARVG